MSAPASFIPDDVSNAGRALRSHALAKNAPVSFVPDDSVPTGSAPVPGMAASVMSGQGNALRAGLLNALPTAAAIGVSMAQPEIGVPLLSVRALAPLAIRAGLTGLAGVGGNVLRQGLMGQNPATPQAALQTAAEGGKQAAFEVGGQLGARAVRTVGQKAVETAYRVSPQLAERFPGIFDAIFKERIPIGTKTGREGTEAAKDLLKTRGAAQRAIPAASPLTFTGDDLAGQAISEAEDIAGQPLNPAERAGVVQKITDRANELLSDASHGVRKPTQTFTAREVDKLRQIAQRRSSGAFNKMAGGDLPNTTPQDLPIATSARELIGRLKGMNEALAATRDAIALRRAIPKAELANLSRHDAMALPAIAAGVGGTLGGVAFHGVPEVAGGSVASALLMRALMEPSVSSRLGFALSSPASVGLLRQIPRMAGGYLVPPDTTGLGQ